MAQAGRSGWNGRCAPQASSTSNGRPRRGTPSPPDVRRRPSRSGRPGRRPSRRDVGGRAGDLVGLRRVREVAAGVEPRRHPHRATPERIRPEMIDLWDCRATNSFSCRPGHRQDRGLHRQRTAAGGEEGVVGLDRVGHELLRARQHPLRNAAVVQAVERGHVGGEHGLAHHVEHPFVDSASLPVARSSVGRVTLPTELLQSLQDRHPRVIHHRLLAYREHPGTASTAPHRSVQPPWPAPRARSPRFAVCAIAGGVPRQLTTRARGTRGGADR